jgi:putative membrane protein insertion efficiency factor
MVATTMKRMQCLLVAALVLLLRIYRLVLSPLLGQRCRFEPSCSRYAEQALRHFGIVRGSLKAAARLGRCHPYHPGGFDPVLPTSKREPSNG